MTSIPNKDRLGNLPEVLESKRLLLKKYQIGDEHAMLGLFERNFNRQFLKEHADEASAVKTIEDANKWVTKLATNWDERKRFVMTIWLKPEEILIGQIWIEPEKWEVPSFQLGWYLDKGYIMMGFATEAARRSMEFIFNDLYAHRITVITRDTNIRSYKLAERLGFKKEGHFRECCIEDGKRWGLMYYGLLRSEFEEKIKKEKEEESIE